MRLVRFEDESGGFAIELHPLLTVVSGLPAHIRERLVGVFQALPGGGDPGGRGLIDVHGVFLELTRDNLQLLELDQDLDVVLRSADLPGTDVAETGSESRSWSLDESDPDVRDAREALAAAKAAAETTTRLVRSLRVKISQLESERGEVRAHLVELDQVTRVATDDVAVARANLAEAEARWVAERDERQRVAREAAIAAQREQAVAGSASTAARRAELESLLTGLIDRSSHLKRELKRLRSLDPMPVRQAHAALQMALSAAAPAPDHSAQVELLSQRWRDVQSRSAAAAAKQSASHRRLAELTARRDRAYEELVEAERAVTAPEPDEGVVDELETVHDEIFDLDGRTSKIGGARIRRRLDELRVREQELLGRLGFDTWSSYVMGISANVADPERHGRFEAARAAFRFAEAELERATAATAGNSEVTGLERERAGLAAETADLIGGDPGADPLASLERFSMPALAPVKAAAPTMSVEDAATALRYALAGAGTDLPDPEPSPHELLHLGGGWVDAMGSLPELLSRTEHEFSDVERDIARYGAEFESLSTGPSAAPAGRGIVEPPTLALDDPAELVATRARVAELAAAAAEPSGGAERSGAEEHLHAIEIRLRDARATLADRERALAAIDEQRSLAEDRLGRLEDQQRARARSAAETSAPGFGSGFGAGMGFGLAPPSEGDEAEESAVGRVGTGGSSGSAGAEAVEWYVLARLAQQRAVSFVGSVPMVLDDSFRGFRIGDLSDVFVRLERMSEVVQIVYLTEDPEVGAWATRLGDQRARVLDLRTGH